jgi:hypothetical protein
MSCGPIATNGSQIGKFDLIETHVQGSAGGEGAAGSNGNGMNRAGSAGLPIAPLRLDSGLQVLCVADWHPIRLPF